MIINNNIPALNTFRQLGVNQNAMQKSMEKLSSGLRINRAGDDAAGLAISEKMRAQIKGLDQASRNSQDGISMIQTAEGALQETQNILQRMRELAVQAANDTNVDVDREEIQKEINQLTSEINRIGNTTEFNTQKLLDGGSGQTGTGDATSFQQVEGSGDITDFDFSGGTTTISIGDQSVDLTTDLTDIDGIIAALDGQFDGITVSNNGNTLQFSGSEEFTVNVTGDAAANLNITDGTDSTDVAVNYAVEGSGDITDFDFSGGTTTISIGDQSVDLTTDLTDIDGIIAALDGQFDGITVSNNGNTLQFSGSEEFTVNVTGDAAANLNITDGADATSNVPAGLELEAAGDGFSANFQIGANNGQSMTINVSDMRAAALGIAGVAGGDHVEVSNEKAVAVDGAAFVDVAEVTDGTSNEGAFHALDVSSHEKASAAVEVVNNAIEAVSAQRSELGAYQNRLEHTISNLDNSSENLSAAESRIRDVDMAKEMMEMTRANILSQASQSMLAQANQQPQSVLQLLG